MCTHNHVVGLRAGSEGWGSEGWVGAWGLLPLLAAPSQTAGPHPPLPCASPSPPLPTCANQLPPVPTHPPFLQVKGSNSDWQPLSNSWGATWEMPSAPQPPLSFKVRSCTQHRTAHPSSLVCCGVQCGNMFCRSDECRAAGSTSPSR